jgi:hypothetical protein
MRCSYVNTSHVLVEEPKKKSVRERKTSVREKKTSVREKMILKRSINET